MLSPGSYIVVLGAGESGVGAAVLAKKKGFKVFVSDRSNIASKYKKQLVEGSIAFEEGTHTLDKILHADVVIKSPGIPDKAPLVQELLNNGVSVISEIEWGYYFLEGGEVIAITGTNGKTTTATLTHHILKSAHSNTLLAGNIGDSFAAAVAEQPTASYVLEVSSFQLDGIDQFRPHISVLTNITPDHLDRYDYSFEKYIGSKMRIVKNQTTEDFFIYDADGTFGRRLSSVVGVARRIKLMPAAAAGRHSSVSSSGGRSTTISPSMPASTASRRNVSTPRE